MTFQMNSRNRNGYGNLFGMLCFEFRVNNQLSILHLQPISWMFGRKDCLLFSGGNVGIDLRGGDAAVAQKGLDVP